MKSSSSKLAPVTLVLLTGINLFNYLDRQILPAVLTPIKDELKLSDGQLGWIATAFMLGYFVTAPLFGYLGDRFSRKVLIASGVAVWSIGTVLSGEAHSLWSLVCFRVLVGLGEASYGTISPAWIADLYAPARRNNALSIFYAAIPLGSALGYIAGGLLATHYGWRTAFWAAGAPGLLLALSLLLLPEPRRGASETAATDAPAASESPPGLRGYFELLGRPLYVLTVLGYIAQTFALGGFAFWGPTFLHRVHGVGLDAADHFFGLSLVASGLVATLLGGFCATAWHRRNPAAYGWVLGLSSLAAAPIGCAAFLTHDSVIARLLLAAAMFCLFLATGPVNTLILETVPVIMRTSAMAVSIFAIHLFGDLGSPQLVGILSDVSGLQKAVLLLPAALVVSAFFWIWLALRLQPPRARAH